MKKRFGRDDEDWQHQSRVEKFSKNCRAWRNSGQIPVGEESGNGIRAGLSKIPDEASGFCRRLQTKIKTFFLKSGTWDFDAMTFFNRGLESKARPTLLSTTG